MNVCSCLDLVNVTVKISRQWYGTLEPLSLELRSKTFFNVKISRRWNETLVSTFDTEDFLGASKFIEGL